MIGAEGLASNEEVVVVPLVLVIGVVLLLDSDFFRFRPEIIQIRNKCKWLILLIFIFLLFTPLLSKGRKDLLFSYFV